MNAGLRLARYSTRYAGLLLVSVVLMAVMGAMTAARTLLIKPIMERVLTPSPDASPLELFRIPVVNYSIYLETFFPKSIHETFTIVAISILTIFFCPGSLRLPGRLPHQLRRPAGGDGHSKSGFCQAPAAWRGFL